MIPNIEEKSRFLIEEKRYKVTNATAILHKKLLSIILIYTQIIQELCMTHTWMNHAESLDEYDIHYFI